MTTHRVVGMAAVLVLVFVPLSTAESSTLATTGPTAVQSPILAPATAAPTKVPVGPHVTPADRTTPQAARANEVSGGVGAIVSGLAGFGGIWVDGAHLTHLAMQRGTSGAALKALGERFKDEYVIETVKYSYRDLVVRRDAISPQVSSLKKQGLDLMEWGPDEAHNTVRIALLGYTPGKAALAKKILGADIIVTPSMATGGANELF